jgi:hypothetical protein
MFNNFYIKALLLAGLALPIAGCIAPQGLDSIVITPSTYTVTLSTTGYGGYWSYKAIGYYGNAAHQVTKDITDQVTWTSLAPIMVTINSSGVATVTGKATGSTSIIASAPGYNGDIVSNVSTFIVQLPTATTN